VAPIQRTPIENRLLAVLPDVQRRRVLARCDQVELAFGDVLYRPLEPLAHVYFPLRGSISLVMPIDDSDMGCDCKVKCTIREAWTRQIAAIEIAPEDALTDQGQETWNLLAARGIDNVILLGVHLNMCVLGRPFAIRQQVQLGKNVVLCRDLTDTMYNPDKAPKVSHFEGTDLVIEHVEKYWCPTITSQDLTGRAPFRFKEDPRKQRGAD